MGIAIFENGKFGYVNPKLAEIFGYTPEEVLRLGSLDIAAHCEAKNDGRNRIEAVTESSQIQNISRASAIAHVRRAGR